MSDQERIPTDAPEDWQPDGYTEPDYDETPQAERTGHDVAQEED